MMKARPVTEYTAADSTIIAATEVYILACSAPSVDVTLRRMLSRRYAMARVMVALIAIVIDQYGTAN